MGMMQVMPGTARHLEIWSPWDAFANMRAGARYLRQQLDRFGCVDLALAAYNAGPERRSLAMGYIPAIRETRNYVRTITTNWLRLSQLKRPDSVALARAAAASTAVRASGYREVSLVTYDGMNDRPPLSGPTLGSSARAMRRHGPSRHNRWPWRDWLAGPSPASLRQTPRLPARNPARSRLRKAAPAIRHRHSTPSPVHRRIAACRGSRPPLLAALDRGDNHHRKRALAGAPCGRRIA